MKISDLLRTLADHVDAKDAQSQEPAPDQENAQNDETSVFVSPLQQKLELLKKSVGVESIFDEPGEEGQGDELDQIKKLSGLPPQSAIIQQADIDSSDPA